MQETGVILTLAYPETIVRVADEWYSPYLSYLGVGMKNYVRAGHAAIVLINKQTGVLEYHDFGRYIVPEPFGRVRGKETDHELEFSIVARMEDGSIRNLDEILVFLATHPKLTHGEGVMLASICRKVNYQNAKTYIANMEQKELVKYAAFGKGASNCARFVTEVLIAGLTDDDILKALKKSKWFTPSTIGNVVVANTEESIFEVSEVGQIGVFKSNKHRENRRFFLDKLKQYQPSFIGNIMPRLNGAHSQGAQWLGGIGSGAWFEIHDLGHNDTFRFKRVSPYGHVDVDGIYGISEIGFDSGTTYEFIPYSNCQFFYIKQKEKVYRFDFIRKLSD